MNSKRNTVQKQLILDAVGELNSHATAEQVYEHVAAKCPTISKATVYRNLRQLADQRKLLNIGTFYGVTHYDHKCHEHSHFVCEQCGQVHDVNEDFADILNRAGKTPGVKISGFQLHFSGLCDKCSGKCAALGQSA
jgi:Fe2+ or Zn2+ uptake regulation protein